MSQKDLLIRFASTLPKNSPERRTILAKVTALSMQRVKEWNDLCQDMIGDLEDILKNRPDLKSKIEKAIEAIDEANAAVQDVE